MNATRRLRGIGREWLAGVLGILALGTAVGVYLRSTRPPAFRFTITAGSPHGLRHQIAERLAADLVKRRVVAKVVATRGSEEALNRIESGALDLALVQGGLGAGNRTHLRQVAALHVEPLQLLVKQELYSDVAQDLEALRGKVVNLSEVGSGTYQLALEVLGFAGMSPARDGAGGDYRISTLSYRDLETEADPSKLPDAIFMVSALPSPVARHLVLKHRYRLVPLSFGEAFALDVLHQDATVFPAGGRSGEVDKINVYMTEIPAFTYGVVPPVPPRQVPTLGTRLLLVARDTVDPRGVRRILETIFSPGFARLARPPLDAKLLDLPPELEWHPGTIQYLERNQPLITGDLIDFLEKGTSIGGAALGGVFCLWQWWRQRYRRRRDLGFEGYILKVTAIERQALELETAAALDLKELLRLQSELSDSKRDALERFADGRLRGHDLISGFVTHVNDVRNYLARLILHERERLEKQARHEKCSPEALWQEIVGSESRPALASGEMGFVSPARDS